MNTTHDNDLDFGEHSAWLPLDRREFLKRLGPGIFIFFAPEDTFALQQEGRGGRDYPEDFNAYLRIGENGRVNCYTGKIEAGQGIISALAQMLAEELEVPFSSVDMVFGDTKLCPWDAGTFGSRSVKYFGPPLRMAAAEAREVLRQLAAEHLQLPLDRLAVKEGVVFDKSNSRKQVSYAALVQGKTIVKHLQQKPALKPPSAFTVCGKSMPRADAEGKTTGKALFSADIRRPGLLYARILRPPAHGATMKSIDLSGAKEIQDAQVIQDGDLIAILHPLPDKAEEALSRIKAQFQVSPAKVDNSSIHKHLMGLVTQGDVLAQKGDLAKGREMAALTFDETYLTPYVAHATLETHSAMAHVERDEVTVWASTQRPFTVQDEIARTFGFPPDKVRVITPYVGAGFGGKSNTRQAIEAIRLSKLSGHPVQVVWTREEEFFFDTFMPAAFVRISSGLNNAQQIVFWDYQVSFAGERSSRTFYNVPHHRTVSAGGRMPGGGSAHPFGTGAWRGPGSNTNTFAMESHMDVMAAKISMDPMDFRLKNLADQRMIRVIKAAAEKFRWTSAKPPSGRGHGMACLDYLGTYVAAMAEIKFDQSTARIHVNRVVVAQDMGQVINPEGARMQIEGCVTMGLGYVLTEEVRFNGGQIKDRSFDTYEIPRFSWLPQIETVLIDNPDLAPQGGGEPAITCMGALIANALYDAAGVRVKRLPLTPETIKHALS